jgi:hypothetical protein
MPNGVMIPIRVTDAGIPVFTTHQVDECDPEQFGFHRYEVIEGYPVYMTSYQDEQRLIQDRLFLIPHRYSRRARFQTTLLQLQGTLGVTRVQKQKHILKLLQPLWDIPESQVWDTARTILKQHRLQIYYNRIPSLLDDMDFFKTKLPTFPTQLMDRVMDDFQRIELAFQRIKKKLHRVYFPNLRFIALQLMDKYQIPYLDRYIPKTRTSKKQVELTHLYKELWVEVAAFELAEELCEGW